MYPYIHIVLPSYTVLALLGAFCSVVLVFVRLERYEIDFDLFVKLIFLCAVGGFCGSKLLFAITRIPWLISNFSLYNLIMLLPQSGLVFYGGLFGVLITIAIYTHQDTSLKKRAYMLCSPAIPLFHYFGRIGCFLTGCCYGKEYTIPHYFGIIEIDRIPVQLIEALAEFVLFIVLLLIEKIKPKANLLQIYLMSYAVIRFLTEFLRGDDIRGHWLGLSTSQWISIFIITYYCIKMYKRNIVIMNRSVY